MSVLEVGTRLHYLFSEACLRSSLQPQRVRQCDGSDSGSWKGDQATVADVDRKGFSR